MLGSDINCDGDAHAKLIGSLLALPVIKHRLVGTVSDIEKGIFDVSNLLRMGIHNEFKPIVVDIDYEITMFGHYNQFINDVKKHFNLVSKIINMIVKTHISDVDEQLEVCNLIEKKELSSKTLIDNKQTILNVYELQLSKHEPLYIKDGRTIGRYFNQILQLHNKFNDVRAANKIEVLMRDIYTDDSLVSVNLKSTFIDIHQNLVELCNKFEVETFLKKQVLKTGSDILKKDLSINYLLKCRESIIESFSDMSDI